MENRQTIEILNASLLENHKWHQELCMMLGADHQRSIRQMEECNKIKQQMREYGE